MPHRLQTQVIVAAAAVLSSAIRQSASCPHRGQNRGAPPIVSRSKESRNQPTSPRPIVEAV